MRRIAFFLCLGLVCVILSGNLAANASPTSGQGYGTFSQYYKDDISFINENDNRHLLPLVIARRASEVNDGYVYYELLGDILTAVLTVNPSTGIIESCIITLTAPSGMEYGTATYNDFAISGYHSFALLMAMHADSVPARRYELVTDVVNGMAAGDGSYSRQLGVYTLTCTRIDNVAVLEFQKSRASETLAPEESLSPGDTDFPVPNDHEEGLL